MWQWALLTQNCGQSLCSGPPWLTCRFWQNGSQQLQKKCREQNLPLYIAIINLTKAFDLICKDGLFKALKKIGCLTAQYNGTLSEPFDICSRSAVRSGHARQCARPNPFWDLQRSCLEICLWYIPRNLPFDHIRWQVLQFFSPEEDQCLKSKHSITYSHNHQQLQAT